MIEAMISELVKENKANETQVRYEESMKKFRELISKGMVTKRENQLLVNVSDLKYNI